MIFQVHFIQTLFLYKNKLLPVLYESLKKVKVPIIYTLST